MGRRALDERTGDQWTRLYAYVFSIAETLEEPPFRPDRGMDPASPMVAQRLDEFRKWFEAKRPTLEALAREQAPEVERARRAMATQLCR